MVFGRRNQKLDGKSNLDMRRIIRVQLVVRAQTGTVRGRTVKPERNVAPGGLVWRCGSRFQIAVLDASNPRCDAKSFGPDSIF